MITLQRPFKDDWATTASFADHLGRRPPSTAPGIDYALPTGTQVLAAADGRILRCEWSSAGGRHIIMEHSGGARTLYCHLNAIWRVSGEKVEAGEIIGLSGNTGHSTGPHLHFGLQVAGQGWVDPALVMDQAAAPDDS